MNMGSGTILNSKRVPHVRCYGHLTEAIIYSSSFDSQLVHFSLDLDKALGLHTQTIITASCNTSTFPIYT